MALGTLINRSLRRSPSFGVSRISFHFAFFESGQFARTKRLICLIHSLSYSNNYNLRMKKGERRRLARDKGLEKLAKHLVETDRNDGDESITVNIAFLSDHTSKEALI